MILFDACAVRAIVTVVTLLAGLSTPPLIIDQTNNLLSSEPELLIAPNDLPSFANENISLSLEWILLRPDHRQCAIVKDVEYRRIVNESLIEAFVDQSLTNLSDNVNSSLAEGVCEVSTHTLPGLTTYSNVGFVQNASHSFKANLSQIVLSSGFVASLKNLQLYIRELILHSLPNHCADWITHNRLTVGLVCVSVMCGSLLCPILYYLWIVIKANEHLTKDLESLNGLNLYMESHLLVVTTEMSKLMETNCVYRKELKETKTQLRQTQLLGIETSDEVALIAKELYSEKCNARRNMEQIKSEHAKALAEVTRKLDDAKRQVSLYQLAECTAKMELASLKNEMEEERMERNSQQQSTFQLMAELQNQLLTTKHTLKGNLETTQQKLRLAADKAIELKLRLADSVLNDSELIPKDSGIFEAWSN